MSNYIGPYHSFIKAIALIESLMAEHERHSYPSQYECELHETLCEAHACLAYIEAVVKEHKS